MDAPESAPSIRVLIAEDEALIRMDLEEMLTEEGFDVIATVSNGEEAVQSARALHPDVCMLDIKMPVKDGLTAAEELMDEVAIVFLTAFSQRELIERASKAGAQAYLVKPFNRSDLLPALEIAVQRFRDMQGLNAQVQDLENKLTARKLIERAKGHLMQMTDMGEEEAFAFIRTQAMNKRCTMQDIAENILTIHPNGDR
ncbi:ANTAR domain-containing response regulator [Stomatohabitans albus]|uniref:ANTAR domain-containing response regulator n=1 Tax=Stomatohabitans albus TaxID=3110766 RepID=UPI00300CF810